MGSTFRRMHYLTDMSLQLRYMVLTFLILAAFLGVSIWVVYVTGWSTLIERLSQVYPQGRLSEILRLIYYRLALGFLILLPISLGVTLLLSHTIAGPLVRIKRYLRLMARGDFELAPLALRRFDELKDVAQLINEITSRVGPRLHERRDLVKSLQETIRALRVDLERLPSAGQEVRRKVDFLVDTLKMLE